MEEECERRGLPVKIRNAEPYREFQNSDDNDRYYGMNEGYWRNQAVNPLNLPQGPVPQIAQVIWILTFKVSLFPRFILNPY